MPADTGTTGAPPPTDGGTSCAVGANGRACRPGDGTCDIAQFTPGSWHTDNLPCLVQKDGWIRCWGEGRAFGALGAGVLSATTGSVCSLLASGGRLVLGVQLPGRARHRLEQPRRRADAHHGDHVPADRRRPRPPLRRRRRRGRDRRRVVLGRRQRARQRRPGRARVGRGGTGARGRASPLRRRSVLRPPGQRGPALPGRLLGRGQRPRHDADAGGVLTGSGISSDADARPPARRARSRPSGRAPRRRRSTRRWALRERSWAE